jgi:hypothetical protein
MYTMIPYFLSHSPEAELAGGGGAGRLATPWGTHRLPLQLKADKEAAEMAESEVATKEPYAAPHAASVAASAPLTAAGARLNAAEAAIAAIAAAPPQIPEQFER